MVSKDRLVNLNMPKSTLVIPAVRSNIVVSAESQLGMRGLERIVFSRKVAMVRIAGVVFQRKRGSE